MKTLILISVLALAIILTACGTDQDQIGEQLPSVETAKDIPDFSRWSKEPDAIDKCLQVDTGKVDCQSEFTAEENCSNATFKFIAIKSGYMFVQTKESVIVRQGEFHQLNFEEKAEIYNITDEYAEDYYSVFTCKGQIL